MKYRGEEMVSSTGISLRIAALLVVALLSSAAVAQESESPTAGPAAEDEQSLRGGTLPRTFRGIALGMNLEALKTALAADELFTFRGDRDVSLLPQKNQTLIETTGLSFVRRAFFQLKDDALFMMAFSLDLDRVDHYSIFTAFVADYGEPASLDPGQAVWLSDQTRVSIERPLTVKYIDRAAFDSLAQDSRVKESKDAVLRQEFIDGF